MANFKLTLSTVLNRRRHNFEKKLQFQWECTCFKSNGTDCRLHISTHTHCHRGMQISKMACNTHRKAANEKVHRPSYFKVSETRAHRRSLIMEKSQISKKVIGTLFRQKVNMCVSLAIVHFLSTNAFVGSIVSKKRMCLNFCIFVSIEPMVHILGHFI